MGCFRIIAESFAAINAIIVATAWIYYQASINPLICPQICHLQISILNQQIFLVSKHQNGSMFPSVRYVLYLQSGLKFISLAYSILQQMEQKMNAKQKWQSNNTIFIGKSLSPSIFFIAVPLIHIQIQNKLQLPSSLLLLMIINRNELVQKMFATISRLRKNRSDYQLFQKFIKIAEYVLLIFFTFWTDFKPSQDDIHAEFIPNTWMNLKEASNLTSAVHFASILVLVLSIFIQIMVETNLSRLSLRFLSKVLALLISGSSWVYEATLMPFLALAAYAYSGSKIFTDSWVGVSLGLFAAFLYVLILKDRKVYGRYLPFLFLTRTFLPIDASILATIAVSLLCWNKAQGPYEKIVYLQMALLEVSEYLRKIDAHPITPQVLLNTGFILAIIPCVQLMYENELVFKENNGSECNERMLEIIQQIQQKSWSSLTVRQKLIIEAFLTSQQQICGKKADPLNDTPDQIIWNAFNAKLSRQIEKNPKDISTLMVKIRLNSLKDANILSTFKMLEQLGLIAANGSLKDRFDAFCFINQTIIKLKLNSTLDFQKIKENDRIQISNEREIHHFIECLIDFWEYLHGETLVEELIMQKLQRLERKRNVLKTHLEHFKKIPNCKNSLIVLQFALKCLNPQHQIAVPPPITQSFPLSKDIEDGISYFFSIEKESIHFMSNSLCKRLGYELLFMNGASKSTILPPYVSNLQQLLFEQQLKSESAVLPLITAKGYIQPFSGRMLIIPNFEGGFSYFFHLFDLASEKAPYLIINITQECIDYTSKSFRSYFRETREKRVGDIDLDELFCFKFDDLVKSSLKECCLEMRVSRDERRRVKVAKICTYKTKKCEYLFIRIEVAKGMERNTMLEIFIHKSIEETAENKYEKYQNERFFCKITHPLENKYNQQVQRLNDDSRWTISQKHGRIFIAIFMIVVFNLVFSKFVAKFNQRSSLSAISELHSVNTARSNLLWLFEECYQLSYLRENNLTFIFSNGNISIPQLQYEIDALIHEIESFRFNYHKRINDLQFQLSFPSFAVLGNTAHTNIVDILQNAKLFLRDNDPSFLVANVDFIRVYNEAYNVLSILQSQTMEQNSAIKYAMMSSVGLIFLILMVVFMDLRNSIEASRHVIKTIMNSKEKIIEGKLKLLRHFKHFLTENEEVYFFREDSNRAQRKGTQLGTLLDQQRQLKTKNELDMRSIIRKEDSIMRKLPAEENQEATEAKKLLFTLHSKTAIFTHRIVAYFREAYFLLIFALLLCYFARVSILSFNLSMEKSKLLAYEDSFFFTERSIISMSVGMYHLALSNGQSAKNEQLLGTVLMNTYFTQTLPPEFDAFTQKKNKLVNSNLCQGISEGISEEACKQMEGGFLTKGLGVAFQQFVSQLKEVSRSLQNPSISKDESLSSLSIIDLIEVLMLQKISQIKAEFFTAVEGYLEDQTNTLIYGILWEQAILLGLILLIYWCGMRGYRQRCGLVVQGFLMLPKEYILNNRLLKYFKKHSVFERIANI